METIFSTKFVLPFFTNCTMYTHPISQPYTSLLQGSCRNSENITFLSIAGLKLFLKIFYFICFYLFWPHGEVSLSASRFYSIHSDSACPQSFPLREMPDSNRDHIVWSATNEPPHLNYQDTVEQNHLR